VRAEELTPGLLAGELHVWRADIASAGEGAEELLSADEHARAERIPGEERRRAWARTHGLLRHLLSRYLGCEPAVLRFSRGPHGKPELQRLAPGAAGPRLRGMHPSAPLSFNISHSGDLALFALADGQAVGVDVELISAGRDDVRLAARALGPAAAARLAGLDPESRAREFTREWVRYEAAVKCRGTGIGHAQGVRDGGGAWIVEIDAGPGAVAAVAAERAPSALRCWTFC
jgi:4'-phosphopantetheinyl transferase